MHLSVKVLTFVSFLLGGLFKFSALSYLLRKSFFPPQFNLKVSALEKCTPSKGTARQLIKESYLNLVAVIGNGGDYWEAVARHNNNMMKVGVVTANTKSYYEAFKALVEELNALEASPDKDRSKLRNVLNSYMIAGIGFINLQPGLEDFTSDEDLRNDHFFDKLFKLVNGIVISLSQIADHPVPAAELYNPDEYGYFKIVMAEASARAVQKKTETN